MKNMKKISLIVFALVAVCFSVSAQKNFLKDGDVAFENAQYYNALEYYKQAFTTVKKPDVLARICFRMGQSYKEMNDLAGAETYYSKAIKAKYPDPIVILYLADVLKAQMKYPQAIVEYNNYKKEVPADIRGENGVKSCELAQQWKDAKNTPESRIKIENMALINSKEADFGPAYADRKYNVLYFTSTRQGAQGSVDLTTGQNKSDLYETKLDKNGKWSTPAALETSAVSKMNEGGASVSKKGDLMFITRCPEEKGKKAKCQLFVCKKQGTSWEDPEKLPFNVDSVHLRHAVISDDGKTLYFDAKLDGTYGGTDIWKSELGSDNVWGKAINLGSSVNTTGNEGFPYITENGKTLYFASNYHIGMGGLDLFKAEKDASGNFSKGAENLKSPINSAGDDFGIIFEGEKTKGYFTSNREGGKGNDDIYSFVLPPLFFNLNGTVVSSEFNEPVKNASVRLAGSNGDLFEFKTLEDGKYNFKLKENTTYEVTVGTDKTTTSRTFTLGFLATKDMGKLTTLDERESKDFVKDFALIGVRGEIRFPAVLYDLGKASLRPESKDSLNFLYQTLIDNPSIVIQLQSHTDSRGDNKKNQQLSEERAKACVIYLNEEKKIPLARLTSKGFGEEKLLVKDVVINKAKTKEEKEALHQKNRRTVFRIVNWDYVDSNATKSEKPVYKPQVVGEEQ